MLLCVDKRKYIDLHKNMGVPKKSRKSPEKLPKNYNSIKKVIAIRIIGKEFPTLNSSNDDVMEHSGSIYSGFSRHSIQISRAMNSINCICVGR